MDSDVVGADVADTNNATDSHGPAADEPYGAFALFDQEAWTGRLR